MKVFCTEKYTKNSSKCTRNWTKNLPNILHISVSQNLAPRKFMLENAWPVSRNLGNCSGSATVINWWQCMLWQFMEAYIINSLIQQYSYYIHTFIYLLKCSMCIHKTDQTIFSYIWSDIIFTLLTILKIAYTTVTSVKWLYHFWFWNVNM